MSPAIPETLAELKVPIGDLEHYPGNPRRGDVAALKASLERNGQYRPIVVNRRNQEVCDVIVRRWEEFTGRSATRDG